MDLEEIGINAGNWVDSAQDRNYWSSCECGIASGFHKPRSQLMQAKHWCLRRAEGSGKWCTPWLTQSKPVFFTGDAEFRGKEQVFHLCKFNSDVYLGPLIIRWDMCTIRFQKKDIPFQKLVLTSFLGMNQDTYF